MHTPRSRPRGVITPLLAMLALCVVGSSFISGVSAQAHPNGQGPINGSGPTNGATDGQAATNVQDTTSGNSATDGQGAADGQGTSDGQGQQPQTDLAKSQERVDLPFGLVFAGDFRLRYEQTTQQEPNGALGIFDPRHRAVVRFRSGVTKQITDQIGFGARIKTGPQGDPNTSDITLGEFADGLDISLDRVYLQWRYQNLFLTGGQFPNPLLSTGLVWDDDVNPQGVAGSYTLPRLGWITPKVTAIYSIVDEQTVNPDSYMVGGQMEWLANPAADLSLRIAGGYYNYTIKSLAHAEAGDILSNNVTADRSKYVSDFDLLDTVAVVEHNRPGGRFPLRFVGNYVKNLGARVRQDEGVRLDLFVGRATNRHEKRFMYGYAATGIDGVLAAFSHDDLTLATNYRQHTLALDYVVADRTTLNLTWYVYRKNDLAAAPEIATDGYISRLRLNALVSF